MFSKNYYISSASLGRDGSNPIIYSIYTRLYRTVSACTGRQYIWLQAEFHRETSRR